jgi:hypothetical protein
VLHLRTINQTTDEPRSQTILNGKVSSRETACTAASTPSTVLLTPFSRRLHGPPRHLRRLQSCSPHSAGAYMVHRGIYAVYSPARPIQQALTWSTAASTPSTVLLTPFSRRLHGPPRHLRRLQSCSPHSAGAYMVHRAPVLAARARRLERKVRHLLPLLLRPLQPRGVHRRHASAPRRLGRLPIRDGL